MPDTPLQRSDAVGVGDSLHGFHLERKTPLDKLGMLALEFTHPKSGARLLHLAADDPENLFSVAFRTPPPDDTGLPHILEHTVLCGSRRYPVKDPFVELLKTSLATFLNAFTYPDRTIYPCSSMNAKDFHNLMRVYCDAAFFPLISRDHFRQEGHHLEFLPDGAPIIKGVVYNEMRGVYSDPEGILDRRLQAGLFDSNAYGHDYGGDPRAIPDLDYERFVAFHRTYYHPSNAWLFTYGNAGLDATLEILDREYLSRFDAIRPDSAIKPLVRWRAPRSEVFPYPLDAGESTRGRTDIAVAWATNDRRDIPENLAMRVVDFYLLDNAASPLRKALIDSRLGEELGGSGHADYQRDTSFTVTLKGSEADRADAVLELVLETIRRECDAGFDAGMIDSALRQLELASREIKPQYPLRLLERVFGCWLYDSDPLSQIAIADRLDDLHAAIAGRPRYLEDIARKWLVDNPHRLRVTLTPDPEYLARSERETALALEATLAGMTEAEQKAARADARRLEAMQSADNSPEALATLPRLALTDVSPDPLPLDHRVEEVDGNDFITVPLYAGGVGYMNVCLEIRGLDADDVDLLPLFCEALSKTGAAGLDYAEMAAREADCAGALEFAPGLVTSVYGADRAALKMGIWLKALDSDWRRALDVLSDRLFRADFGDRDRLRDILLQSRVAWRNQIVPAANAYAALYAGSRLTPALALVERLTGCAQARYIDRLAARLEDSVRLLPDRLTALREKILAGALPSVAQIGAEDSLAAGRDWLGTHGARFGGAGGPVLPVSPLFGPALRAGLAVPADVAFAARALPAPALSDPDAPALALLSTQLSYGYLWNEIRVKGGAYGARAAYDGARGALNFSSYRDPNVNRTLDAFSGAPRHVAEEMDLSPSGLEQSVIGTVKTLDQPLRPPTAVVAALNRHLGGDTEAFRREFRRRLLSLDAEAVRTAAARVFAGMAAAPVCVIASREKLAEENESPDGKNLAIEPLWEPGE